jgi:hypothetical protein
LFEEVKERTFQASVGRFIELEDMFYIWNDSMRCAKLPVPPSLAIAKRKTLLLVFPFQNLILRHLGNG